MRPTFLYKQAHEGQKHVYFFVQIQDTIQYVQCNKYKFGGMTPLFLFILISYITFIRSITFIQYIHPSSFTKVPLHILIAGQWSAQWEKPPFWGAEPRIKLGPRLTASRRTTN
jgi:hypothetical protein